MVYDKTIYIGILKGQCNGKYNKALTLSLYIL